MMNLKLTNFRRECWKIARKEIINFYSLQRYFRTIKGIWLISQPLYDMVMWNNIKKLSINIHNRIDKALYKDFTGKPHD